MTKIINAIKNNKDFMKKLSKHYNNPEEILNNYLKKVNDSKNSYERVNKRSIKIKYNINILTEKSDDDIDGFEAEE